jgi:hypothetical protein
MHSSASAQETEWIEPGRQMLSPKPETRGVLLARSLNMARDSCGCRISDDFWRRKELRAQISKSQALTRRPSLGVDPRAPFLAISARNKV